MRDRVPGNDFQDELHALFYGTGAQVCALRRKFRMLFEPFFQNCTEPGSCTSTICYAFCVYGITCPLQHKRA